MIERRSFLKRIAAMVACSLGAWVWVPGLRMRESLSRRPAPEPGPAELPVVAMRGADAVEAECTLITEEAEPVTVKVQVQESDDLRNWKDVPGGSVTLVGPVDRRWFLAPEPGAERIKSAYVRVDPRHPRGAVSVTASLRPHTRTRCPSDRSRRIAGGGLGTEIRPGNEQRNWMIE